MTVGSARQSILNGQLCMAIVMGHNQVAWLLLEHTESIWNPKMRRLDGQCARAVEDCAVSGETDSPISRDSLAWWNRCSRENNGMT